MTEKDIPILDKLGVDIGYKTSHVKTVSAKDIDLFAEVSGDFNPVHMELYQFERSQYGQQTQTNSYPVKNEYHDS